MGVDFLWDGTGLNYREGYSIAIIRLLGMVGGLLIAITIILQLIINFLSKDKKPAVYEKVDAYVEVIRPTPCVRRLEVISNVIFWIGIGIISLIFSLYSGFDYIPTVAACFIIIVLYTFALTYQIFRWSLYDDSVSTLFKKLSVSAMNRKISLIASSVILLTLAILIPFVFQKTCLCFQTIGYGVPLGSFALSTQMTRGKWLPDKVCMPTSICHIYATLPSNTQNSVFINIHTGKYIKTLFAVFNYNNIGTQQLQQDQTYQCQNFGFPSQIEDRGQRNIFTCVITKLQSNTKYNVNIINQNQTIYNTTYKTLPSNSETALRNFTVLFGGDFGYSGNGLNLLKQFAASDPDIILVGGDVAYDNAMIHCYYSWDLMLSAFEKSFAPLNRLVPIVVAVGNHDVGMHSMSYTNITVSEEQGPLFFTYFPQEFLNQENQTGVMEVAHRKTYVYHFIGNLMLITLDSGYLYDFGDPQTSWLKSTFQNLSQNYTPIVQYHNPMFPTCFVNGTPKDNSRQLHQSKDIWLPIFDQYGVIAAFENHVHQFKRTFPIKNGQPNLNSQNGIVFFGDGSMGVGGGTCASQYLTNQTFTPGFFATYDIGYFDHFWILTQYTNKSIEFIAYGSNSLPINNSFYQIDRQQTEL